MWESPDSIQSRESSTLRASTSPLDPHDKDFDGARDYWPPGSGIVECGKCGREVDWDEGTRADSDDVDTSLFRDVSAAEGVEGTFCCECRVLLDLARGIVKQNSDCEEELGVAERDRFATQVSSASAAVDAVFAFILALPDHDGRARGDLIRGPAPFDLTDKGEVRRRIEVLKGSTCPYTLRPLVLVAEARGDARLVSCIARSVTRTGWLADVVEARSSFPSTASIRLFRTSTAPRFCRRSPGG